MPFRPLCFVRVSLASISGVGIVRMAIHRRYTLSRRDHWRYSCLPNSFLPLSDRAIGTNHTPRGKANRKIDTARRKTSRLAWRRIALGQGSNSAAGPWNHGSGPDSLGHRSAFHRFHRIPGRLVDQLGRRKFDHISNSRTCSRLPRSEPDCRIVSAVRGPGRSQR